MPLPLRFDPSTAEPHLQSAWETAGLYHFDPSDPRPIFAVDTPPPTVSGEIHIGHVYSYVQAEAMIRFWRMQGYNVFYPFGFDDNGLPTERFVERSHGIRANEIGRAAFIEACLQTSTEVEERFEQFWKRLGMSVDWRHRYSTITPIARRTAQWSFIDLFNQGRIYRAQAPNPWCTECATAVAQAELEDAERDTIFYTIAFGLGDDRQPTTNDGQIADGMPGRLSSFIPHPSSFPIATTRPELLPACVAIFVHPDDERFSPLIGHSVIVPLGGQTVPILADAAVDPTKGSGAVMCCTFGDTTDVQWWREHQLPLIPLITRQGRLSEHGGPYAGLTLAEARKRILADLHAAGLIIAEQHARQSIRVHERCGTPLEILETWQWFVKILDAKTTLLEAGRRIEWRPAHLQQRYESWVNGLSYDWCISRQRYFGVAFPVWHCRSCGAIVLAELTQLPIDPQTDPAPHPCTCGSTDLRPDDEVMDTWFTSSLSPQIAAHMFDQPELYPRLFPMALRPQAHEIIRTWTFYTIVKSLFHFGELPWRTVMLSGHALDPSGRKLSKSKGNAPTTPLALIERHGADAVRYWACRASLGGDQPLTEETMRQGRRLVNKLWSAARLCEPHLRAATANPLDGNPSSPPPPTESACAETTPLPVAFCMPTDRWLLSALQRTIEEATARWRAYEYAAGLELAERFFWGTFCDQYLELVKGRLYDGDQAGRESAQATIAITLEAVLKLLAPVMPHITEELYGRLFPDQGSLHTSSWPQADPALLDPAAEATGEALVAIAGAVRRHKTALGQSLGAPLSGLTIACAIPALCADLAAAALDITSVTRAARLTWSDSAPSESSEIAPGLWLAIEE
jgi:valyl-tRNA synthetase